MGTTLCINLKNEKDKKEELLIDFPIKTSFTIINSIVDCFTMIKMINNDQIYIVGLRNNSNNNGEVVFLKYNNKMMMINEMRRVKVCDEDDESVVGILEFDERVLITVGSLYEIKLWDINEIITDESNIDININNNGMIYCFKEKDILICSSSRNYNRNVIKLSDSLFVVSSRKNIKVYNVKRKVREKIFQFDIDPNVMLKINNHVIIIGGYSNLDNLIMVDVNNGVVIRKYKNNESVNCLNRLKNRDHLFASGCGKMIKIWDIEKETAIKIIKLASQSFCLGCFNNYNVFYCATRSGINSLKLFSIDDSNSYKCIKEINHDKRSFCEVVVLPNSSLLTITREYDKKKMFSKNCVIEIYDTRTLKDFKPNVSSISNVDESKHKEKLYTGIMNNDEISLNDITQFENVRLINSIKIKEKIISMDVVNQGEGSFIIYGLNSGKFVVYDNDRRKIVTEKTHCSEKGVRKISVFNEELIATGSNELIKLWKLKNNGELEFQDTITKENLGEDGYYYSCSDILSLPNDILIFGVGGVNSYIVSYDILAKKIIKKFKFNVNHIIKLSNEKVICAGEYNKKNLLLWNVTNGKKERWFNVGKNMKNGKIRSIVVLNNEKFVTSSDGDGDKKIFSIWNVNKSSKIRELVCPLVDYSSKYVWFGSVLSCLSSDLLISKSLDDYEDKKDGSFEKNGVFFYPMRFWNVKSGKLIKEMKVIIDKEEKEAGIGFHCLRVLKNKTLVMSSHKTIRIYSTNELVRKTNRKIETIDQNVDEVQTRMIETKAINVNEVTKMEMKEEGMFSSAIGNMSKLQSDKNVSSGVHLPDLKQTDLVNDNQDIKNKEESCINQNNIAINTSNKKINYTKTKNILGKGTFGVVFKAYISLKDGENIVAALKEIDFIKLRKYIKSVNYGIENEVLENVIAKQRENAVKEIEMLEKLNHENIIKYYGHEILENSIVILTQYASEGTLKQVFDVIKTVDERVNQCKEPFRMVLKGLEYLHKKKIIHKDIKPQNIFLTYLDGREVVKIGDIGISKYSDKQGTQLTSFTTTCTREYASPEFLKYTLALNEFGEESKRTKEKCKKIFPFSNDIYALGITFVQILTKKYPKKKYDSDLNPLIPESIKNKEMRDLLAKCLMYNPKERWSSSRLLNHPLFK